MHMKNGLIEKAIEKFKNKRLGVYRADPDQIVRDTRVAERATKDHVGRWLFELLQNSDDAGASEVRILLDTDTLYIADNGRGLKPEAVRSICGTDFSDKTAGTIGRKGVGFKSVYEISQNPQVLTVGGEGIEFSPEKTKVWLRENDLYDSHVPYQWIPFVISWDDIQQNDVNLQYLKTKNFKTIVRLTGLSPENRQKVEQLLMAWPPHALFAFRHLRRITAPNLKVTLAASDGVWSLYDSRGQTPERWRVSRLTERAPEKVLENLSSNERRAIFIDGISFLIAAPLDDDCVVPTKEYLPIHVFYPTEEKGPVRLLLHAEFLVKSDRTALIPINQNPFNAWVAGRLATHVCRFVHDSYHHDKPSRHLALLVPFDDRESHPVTHELWHRIADRAKEELRFADIESQQRLTVNEARLISVSVRADQARSLLEATSIREQLLHPAFDDDKEARKALRKLGCREIDDQNLMAIITENADSLADNSEWIWACWKWLAAWIAEKPYGKDHRERLNCAKALPVVPVNDGLMKASDLEGRIVTWRPDGGAGDLPDWLPLTFVDDWFRDRMQKEVDSPVRKLAKELGIDKPGTDVIQRAMGRAIEQYWKNKQGNPGRFLRFILKQDWYETSEATKSLQRCPVLLSRPIQGETWVEARKAYFGREWDNSLLADLYINSRTAPWVAREGIHEDQETLRRVLEWLGVAYCPRIIEDSSQTYVWQLPEDCKGWKEYLGTARDDYGRHVERVSVVSRLDHLMLNDLNPRQGALLIRLIAKHWRTYYSHHTKIKVEGTKGREQYYRWWSVKAKWWWEICEELPVPRQDGGTDHVSLAQLWLPDKRTQRAIGSLLPVIDLATFGKDEDAVQDWLIITVGLRTKIDQLAIEEWKALLSRHIPNKAPAERLMSDERLRDKVTRWYTACLETLAEQEKVSEKVFASCPLLCRKGDVWQYVADEPRYLDDDNDLATAFAEDVWLFHVPTRLADDAVKYFSVFPLSQSVQVNVTPAKPQSPLSGELQERFRKSLPYVWAWRSSQSKQAAETLSVRLKGLNVFVVPALKASMSLGNVHREVERRWHVNEYTIYLHKDHVNEAELAQALAFALNVRSEADFYENLLRCTDDRQRKEKLLSKGIAQAEIDRCLREYSRHLPEEEHDEGPRKPTSDGQDGSASQTPSGGGSQGHQPKQPPAVQPGETSEATSSRSPESRKHPLRLKDPHTTPYALVSPPSRSAGSGGSGEGRTAGREGHSLTGAEKAKLEEASRTLVARALKRMGFSVEEMPQHNPGFDLRAKKDGDELRVEVKAHKGRATIVEVTHREYKEYLSQRGYSWELWNVEHLAEDDSHQVVITRYNQIPDDALDVRTFRVDLKKCKTRK
ncbi:MAG TPA: hypothetical protein ENJ35_01065 [Gammaproteobacteria bacterium]|nr:hypothetical protein [Gammaproteobacteria bacterium]